jgi:hypothetical protein
LPFSAELGLHCFLLLLLRGFKVIVVNSWKINPQIEFCGTLEQAENHCQIGLHGKSRFADAQGCQMAYFLSRKYQFG